MDNNFDNTPKDNDNSQQTTGGLNAEGQNNSTVSLSKTDPVADQQQTDTNAGSQQYTDPNAGQQPYNYQQQYQYTSQNDYNQQTNYNYNQQNNGYNYGQQSNSYNYGQQNQNQQTNGYNYGQQNYNYQDNYSYNTGNTGNYNPYGQGQDSSPMTMGDWILTLLAAMIPCVGIVLYFVWAFSKTTNINRRNFCRAQLVIMGIVFAIYLIFIVLFGTAIFSSGLYY